MADQITGQDGTRTPFYRGVSLSVPFMSWDNVQKCPAVSRVPVSHRKSTYFRQRRIARPVIFWLPRWCPQAGRRLPCINRTARVANEMGALP
jgi:hypothetical protein